MYRLYGVKQEDENVNNKWEGCKRQRSWHYFEVMSQHLVERMGKTTRDRR